MPPESILFITDRYPPHPGGLARSSQRLAQAARGAGCRVSVLVLREDGPPGGLLSSWEGDVHVHRLGTNEDPAAQGQAASQVIDWLCESERFALLHGQYAGSGGFLAAYHGRRLQIPSFVSLRGNDVDRDIHDPQRAPQLLFALARASALGAVSRALVRDARALSGRDDVRFTPNSVDGELFRPVDGLAARQMLGVGTSPVIGFTGELRAKKGAAFLFEAFLGLPDDLGAHLLLVGTIRPDERRLLDDLLAEHPHLSERLHTLPYTHNPEELCRLYAAMDVVVCPSVWEGMPNAVLEAMACGRPVLASDAGGIADLITPSQTGWLLSRHVLHRLGEALCEVLLLPVADRATVGARAREHVLATFPPERETRELFAAYAAAGVE